MVARVVSSAVFGHGRPGLVAACPAFLQFSARLGGTNPIFNRYSSRVPQPQESSQSNKLVQLRQRDAGRSLRPKIKSQFNALIDAAKDEHKHLTSRDQFSLAIDKFLVREKYRKGHIAFIRLAMQRLDEFGLEKDLATYNKLLRVFPEGRFKPRRMLDALWPRSLPQMELALDLLTKMEDNGVNPSMETYHIVKEVFGRMSFPFQKCVRMMYLFDKYENADPYKIHGELPTNPVELARLTLKRIAGKDGQITEHMVPKDCDTEYVAESPFLLSASSGAQVKQLESIDEAAGLLLHIEGPNRLWLRSVQTHYFSLKMSKQDSSDDPADEGAVLGVCMCHPGSQESLQDWLGALQDTYPTLAKATVVYNIRKTESPSSSASDSSLQLPPHRTRLSSGELGSIEERVTDLPSHDY